MNNTSVILYRINQQKNINSFQWEFENSQNQGKAKEQATAYFYTLEDFDEARFENLDNIPAYFNWKEALKNLPTTNSILLIIKKNETDVILNHYDKEVLPENVYCLYNHITNIIIPLSITDNNLSNIQDLTYILPFDTESSKLLKFFYQSLSGFPNWEKDLLLEKLMMHDDLKEIDDKLNQWEKTKKWLVPLTLISSIVIAVLSITHIAPHIKNIFSSKELSPFQQAISHIETTTTDMQNQSIELTKIIDNINRHLKQHTNRLDTNYLTLEELSDNTTPLDEHLQQLTDIKSQLLSISDSTKQDKADLKKAKISLLSLKPLIKKLEIAIKDPEQPVPIANSQETKNVQLILQDTKAKIDSVKNLQTPRQKSIEDLNKKLLDIEQSLTRTSEICDTSINKLNSKIALARLLSEIEKLSVEGHPDSVFKEIINNIKTLISNEDNKKYSMLLGLSYFMENINTNQEINGDFTPIDNRPYSISIDYYKYTEKHTTPLEFDELRLYLLSKVITYNKAKKLKDLYKDKFSNEFEKATLSNEIVKIFLNNLNQKISMNSRTQYHLQANEYTKN